MLSVIWGNSFILTKARIKTLSVYQIASLRITSAGLAALPLTVRKLISQIVILTGVYIANKTGKVIAIAD
ncbi:MAG: hypothetical protein ABI834_04645 [Ginsengibacter sp.]